MRWEELYVITLLLETFSSFVQKWVSYFMITKIIQDSLNFKSTV